MGLAKDWNVSKEEAQDTLDKWFADRPEVLRWQEATIKKAMETGYTETLMGRLRHLPDINHSKYYVIFFYFCTFIIMYRTTQIELQGETMRKELQSILRCKVVPLML